MARMHANGSAELIAGTNLIHANDSATRSTIFSNIHAFSFQSF